MVNLEHLRNLQQGAKAFNKWRDENSEIKPNLSKADLRGANLGGADLRGANLGGSNLRGMDVDKANFSRAKNGGHHDKIER